MPAQFVSESVGYHEIFQLTNQDLKALQKFDFLLQNDSSSYQKKSNSYNPGTKAIIFRLSVDQYNYVCQIMDAQIAGSFGNQWNCVQLKIYSNPVRRGANNNQQQQSYYYTFGDYSVGNNSFLRKITTSYDGNLLKPAIEYQNYFEPFQITKDDQCLLSLINTLKTYSNEINTICFYPTNKFDAAGQTLFPYLSDNHNFDNYRFKPKPSKFSLKDLYYFTQKTYHDCEFENLNVEEPHNVSLVDMIQNSIDKSYEQHLQENEEFQDLPTDEEAELIRQEQLKQEQIKKERVLFKDDQLTNSPINEQSLDSFKYSGKNQNGRRSVNHSTVLTPQQQQQQSRFKQLQTSKFPQIQSSQLANSNSRIHNDSQGGVRKIIKKQ